MHSVEAKELDLEDEGSVGRDDRRVAIGTVGHVGRSGESDLLANAHLSDTLIPSADHLADAEGELELLATVSAAVELAAVGKVAIVVDGHGLASLREVGSVAWGKSLNLHSAFTLIKSLIL